MRKEIQRNEGEGAEDRRAITEKSVDPARRAHSRAGHGAWDEGKRGAEEGVRGRTTIEEKPRMESYGRLKSI